MPGSYRFGACLADRAGYHLLEGDSRIALTPGSSIYSSIKVDLRAVRSLAPGERAGEAVG